MILSASTDSIARAAELISKGKLVAFPTETVYGLGASAYNAEAVERVFAVKSRPAHNPLIVHIASVDDVHFAARLPIEHKVKERFAAVSQFWPGPLSIVLPKNPRIAPAVSAGLDTVAVRVPDNAVARAIIREARCPIAAPSANVFGSVSPTTAQHVEESLADTIDLVIDGGPCRIGLESTVISLLGEKVQILRPGGITREDLSHVLSPGDLAPVELKRFERANTVEERSGLLSPGMLASHYAPRTPLYFKEDFPIRPPGKRVGLICFKEPPADFPGHEYAYVWILSKDGDLDEVAAKLFAALRQMDGYGLDLLLVDSCPEDGIGYAIMDRLRRATYKG